MARENYFALLSAKTLEPRTKHASSEQWRQFQIQTEMPVSGYRRGLHPERRQY